MKTFTFRVEKSSFPTKFNQKSVIYEKTFSADNSLIEIEKQIPNLLGGEGFTLTSTIDENKAYFEIVLFGDLSLGKLNEFLLNYPQEASHTQPKFTNSSLANTYYLQINEDVLTEANLQNIQDYLRKHGVDYKIVRHRTIFERGASGPDLLHWIFSFNLSEYADYITIYSFFNRQLKLDIAIEAEPESHQIPEIVKRHMIDVYNISVEDVSVEKFTNMREENVFMVVFRTGQREYRVQTNFARTEILDSEIINL